MSKAPGGPPDHVDGIGRSNDRALSPAGQRAHHSAEGDSEAVGHTLRVSQTTRVRLRIAPRIVANNSRAS
jgi:hypothetical protein